MIYLRENLSGGCPRHAAWALAAMVAFLTLGCAPRRSIASIARPQTCREVVPEPEPLLQWIAPEAAKDRRPLSDWCATVGPILYYRHPSTEVPAVVDRLVVVTWNVHVGGGDVGQLIRRLERGEYTNGEPVRHFVLLLQEAYRRNGGVPGLAAGLKVPARIGSRNPEERGADIERIAREERLALLYAPSMRNGADPDAPEDRGNAIVSTLSLQSPAVIELPFEHQRRAVAAAVVEARTRTGNGWRLRVADAHFDTALALTSGGPLAARRRQAAALIDALSAAPEDTVLGGDLNTWLGSREPALKALRQAFPEGVNLAQTTWKGPLGLRASLDHLLVRGRAKLRDVARLPDRLGSDHYPVLGIVEF